MIYYGITIGPIVETMGQATTPASLWYSSYLFSELTKYICMELSEIEEANIISPYYEEKQETSLCVGYGKYHDRIIFFVSDDVSEKVKEKIRKVITCEVENAQSPFGKIVSAVSQAQNPNEKEKDVSFLSDYIQIKHIEMQDNDAMILEKGGVINALNYYLDCLEMQRNLFKQNKDLVGGTNLFQNLFYAAGESQNQKIKDSVFYSSIENALKENQQFTLLSKKDSNSIRMVEDIAGYTTEGYSEDGLRKRHYFAVVQADGDNMGKYIKSLEEKCEKEKRQLIEVMKEFSKKCMKYTTQSAEMIMDYGGTVIFAGGDDLLFLAPIQPSGSSNIYTLISEISECFNKIFEKDIEWQIEHGKEKEKLSLSFGVSMNRDKFPLYEAFRSSRNLLFAHAKEGNCKNNIAISLRKGNSVSFGVKMKITSDVFKKYSNLIKNYYSNKVEEEQIQKINSVIYLFENWGHMFAQAFEKDDSSVDNLFENILDHEIHEDSKEFIEDIKEFSKCVYCASQNGIADIVLEKDKKETKKGIQNIVALLQMAKFLVEKNTDQE